MPSETAERSEATDAPRRRARPLPTEERRAAIIAAARPLIVAQGATVSTREIAEAAGVAEGTLFRVFRTKEEIVDAVVADALDPTRGLHRLEAIDRTLPLQQRLTRLVEVMQAQIREITTLFIALRSRPREPREDDDHERHTSRHAARNEVMLTAIAEFIGPDADQLRVSARDAAGIISAWSFMSGNPMFSSRRHDPADVVDLLLHGLVRTPDHDSLTSVHEATGPNPEEGPTC